MRRPTALLARSAATAAASSLAAVVLMAAPASAHPGHGSEPAVTAHPVLAALGVLLVTVGSLVLTLGVQALSTGGGTTVWDRPSVRVVGGLLVAAFGAYLLL